MKPTVAGAYPCWTADEDARLRQVCTVKAVRGAEGWLKVAESFPGRSYYAVRQRWLILRNNDAGIKRDRSERVRPPREQKRARPSPTARQQVPILIYASPAAEHLGDPPLGRSALDKRKQADARAVPTLLCDLPRRSPLDQILAGLA